MRKMSTPTPHPPHSPSSSSDEFEDSLQLPSSSDSDTDVLAVDWGDEDYYEIPRRRKGKDHPPPTKTLPHIPKEKLLLFRNLYEKQHQKVKDYVRFPFCEGRPVVRPSPLSSFINKVRHLKERKKVLKKKTTTKREGDPEGLRRAPTVTHIQVQESSKLPSLIHVDYPARIDSVEKAMATMGGVGQVTKVFSNVNRKLQVKFRPEDVTCNAVKGDPTPKVGILLRVRVRRRSGRRLKEREHTRHTSSAQSEPQPLPLDEESIVLKGVRVPRTKIVQDDEALMRRLTERQERVISGDNPGRFYLKIPDTDTAATVTEDVSLDPLGFVVRTYCFDGISDFQYLSSKKTFSGDILCPPETAAASPWGEEGDAFYCGNDSNDGDDDDLLLPPMMSRVEKPLDMISEQVMDASYMKLSKALGDQQITTTTPTHTMGMGTGRISATRCRRNVYTIFHNFQQQQAVPTEPLKDALVDLQKRSEYVDCRKILDKCFQERPVWTRVALECSTNQTPSALKYALPSLAFFATNGPWRASWIRFGYDPRTDPTAFLFQSFDYRVPAVYKQFMEDDHAHSSSGDDNDGFYKFKPRMIPPRHQTFYHVSHVLTPEISRLIEIALKKAELGELVYDPNYGWLKKGTFDYMRHVVTSHIEMHLEELGKIPKHPLTLPVLLKDGELELDTNNEDLLLRGRRPRQPKRFRSRVGNKKRQPTTSSLGGGGVVIEGDGEKADDDSSSYEEEEN